MKQAWRVLGLLLCLTWTAGAFGQGASVVFPPLQGPQGQNIAFGVLHFCSTPTVVTAGVCSTPVTVYTDIALTTPYSSAITTDGLGNFPPNAVTSTALYFTPAANLCFSVSGPVTSTTCTPFSVPYVSGSSPVFGTVNATTGYQVNGAATSGHVLRGNGTDFVDAALVAGDIPSLPASQITSGQLALARGGTNADLSATGGTSQVLKQTSVGGAVTVARLAASDLSDTPTSGNVLRGNGSAFISAQLASSDLSDASSLATLTGAQTLTNKRNTPRVQTAADATSITPTSDSADITVQTNTQIAGTLTINAPTGTPTDGQQLIIRPFCTNAQTYSFNAAYAFSTSVTAPTTCAAGKTDYIGAIWDARSSKWDVVAYDGGH